MPMDYYKWVKNRDAKMYSARRPADKEFLEKLALHNDPNRRISEMELECIQPYTRCKIALDQAYVRAPELYTYEPKPYVFRIYSEKERRGGTVHTSVCCKTVELDVNTGTLTFGGHSEEKLEIDLSEVPEDEKQHISMPAEEISKLHTWLCSFAELRDTVVPSERGAQVWRARKPIELNISQVFHFLDTEWKSMHSKMQLLEQHLRDMQLKVQTLDEKSGQKQSLSTTRLQAQNLYNVM